MIRINFDHQIYSLQRFGGATRYFMNLARCLLAEPCTQVQLQLGFYDSHLFPTSIRPFISGIPDNKLAPEHGVLRFFINELAARWYHLESASQQQSLVHHCTYIYPVHRRRTTPLVVTHHDCTVEKFKDQFSRSELTIKVKDKIYRQADRIITISEHSKTDLLNYYDVPEHKIHVIHHGIESPLPRDSCLSPFPAEPAPYLLYVGARTPYKNFDGLLKAFSLSKVKSDFILVAAGGGKFTDPELALMQALGIREKVLGLPSVSQAELGWLYYHAHGMVYPSTYEGFGFPPLEAMSMGCPTLASDASCLPEVLGDGCLFFVSTSDDDLAGQLEVLCYDQSMRETVIMRGAAVVPRYTWAETANKTRRVYELALG